ncbi:MAG: hypothetical protein A4S17_13730 [Proteobacteria bacterium HN_bin10]|nr:MAG: hypothetical protein A4S17_13730 [Proteobacteria bacterium HN_bin10]
MSIAEFVDTFADQRREFGQPHRFGILKIMESRDARYLGKNRIGVYKSLCNAELLLTIEFYC